LQHLLGEETTADLELFAGGADDFLFAAPQYWAAFILIGDPA